MARKAELISTGEIVEVYADMDYHGNTTWLDTSTKTEYYPSELKFLPDEVMVTSEEESIEGWLTRSKNGNLIFSDSSECKRGHCVWYHKEGANVVDLSNTGLFDNNIFPSVTWETDPFKIKIIIIPTK